MKRIETIFALVPECEVPSGYYKLLYDRHIYQGLGSAVKRMVRPVGLDYSWARQKGCVAYTGIEKERAAASEELWRQIQAAHAAHGLDAIFSVCYTRDVEEGVVRNAVKLGIPWINFFCDSMQLFEEVEGMARSVSLNWFPETGAVGRYGATGARSLCAPYAMNPEFLPDLGCGSGAGKAGFVGLPSTNRITQLGYLAALGCPVEIRGYGWVGENQDPFYNAEPLWKRTLRSVFQKGLGEKIQRRFLWPLVRKNARGPLSDEEFPKFVRECGVLLGLNQGKDSQGRFSSYLKFRDVEFPGYGCCYLTELNDDVPRAFEVGKEVLTYRSMFEAAEHLKRATRDPEWARKIGLAGRRRVLEEHTWPKRLRQIEAAL